MTKKIPPNPETLKEALSLSSEILQNIELSEISLTNIALKTSRLARFLNDYDVQKIMEYEAGGYPSTPSGVTPETWRLVLIAGRTFERKDYLSDEIKQYCWTESISEWEQQLLTAEKEIEAARDPDVSISSSNPYQMVKAPEGHSIERVVIANRVTNASRRIAERRTFIYSYVLQKNHELKYSGIANEIFSRIREKVDNSIGAIIPKSIQRLSSIYDNLNSENPEDWSNAVHSCRRILKDLSDELFKPSEETRTKDINGKKITIKLGEENYINRLIAFIEDNSDSDRFKHIVGSHLEYIGERIDSIVLAANKGTHNDIVSRQEADRYVVYTYLLIGDILSLSESITY
jgi:hypothetical protein